jgi:hypothetical protein
MPLTTADLTLQALRAAYAAGALTPTSLCQQLLPALAASRSVFITKAWEEDIYERCRWDKQPAQGAHCHCCNRHRRWPTQPSPARYVPCLLCTLPAPAGSWRRCRRSSGARCGGCLLQ